MKTHVFNVKKLRRSLVRAHQLMIVAAMVTGFGIGDALAPGQRGPGRIAFARQMRLSGLLLDRIAVDPKVSGRNSQSRRRSITRSGQYQRKRTVKGTGRKREAR